MDPQNPHLSQIATLWSVVRQAHGTPGDARAAAMQQLIERYGGSVQRYLTKALRSPEGASDLFQEFAAQFLQGTFKGADPQRGRFRDYLKTSLRHLVAQHFRKQARLPHLSGTETPEPAVEPSIDDIDRDFTQNWREHLLSRSWDRLKTAENETGQPFFAVLRFRADHPDASSNEMAEQLSAQLGKTISSTNVRQLLHRARERFADGLLDEVVHSLETDDREMLEQELMELNLYEYCRPALERRQQE
jgi:RNA polymerase sigma-70 factor (ECF subfamily)